jgi:hypothetical protein
MSQPLDSATPGRPPNVPFFGWERYVFMLLCEKKCACGHGLRLEGSPKVAPFFQSWQMITHWYKTYMRRFGEGVKRKKGKVVTTGIRLGGMQS